MDEFNILRGKLNRTVGTLVNNFNSIFELNENCRLSYKFSSHSY